jgi:ammonia channel protein AmtB
MQAMIIGGIGVLIAYKMHYWVERRVKLDDAVGAVAVHGYAGFFGVFICGFVLWGYPASPNTDYASINPLGQFLGAIIMFGVLGFLPGYIAAKIMNAMGALRIPREIELAGLDFGTSEQYRREELGIIKAELEEINKV